MVNGRAGWDYIQSPVLNGYPVRVFPLLILDFDIGEFDSCPVLLKAFFRKTKAYFAK
jgi:hypothetical protein